MSRNPFLIMCASALCVRKYFATSVNLKTPIQANTPPLQINLNEFGATSKGYLQSAARPSLSARQAPTPEFHYCCEKIGLNKLWAPNAVSAFSSFLVNFGRTNPMRYGGSIRTIGRN
jgi:hypothetical protein